MTLEQDFEKELAKLLKTICVYSVVLFPTGRALRIPENMNTKMALCMGLSSASLMV
jgi:hypothetical protein